MIATDCQPFSIVEDPGFKDVMNVADPRYALPTRKQLRENELPRLYEEEKAKIDPLLKQQAKDVSITTDMWTDTHNMKSYMAKTAHFSDDNFNLYNISLETTPFPDRHTAQNLREDLVECWERWGISDKVRVVVKDNASNIAAAVRDIPNVEGLECFAHTLNLAVREALTLAAGIMPTVDKCRQVVHIFKSSTLAASKLEDYRREKKRNPILTVKKDVVTRWNSTYTMICSVLALKRDLPTVLSFLQRPNVPILVYNEWTIIEEIVKILAPFEAATREMSAGKYVSISKIIQIVKCIQEAMENIHVTTPEVEQLRQNLQEQVTTRFGDVENNKIYGIATICDPRFKTVPFSSEEKKKQCIAWVLDEVKKASREDDEARLSPREVGVEPAANDPDGELDEENNNDHDYADKPPTYYRDASLWASFDRKVASRRRTTKEKDTDFEIELKRYIDCSILDRKADPMIWWKQEGRTLFPNVAKVAKKFLPIPATSVPSECIFSKCSIILSDRRTRLKPKYVNQLVFLSANKRT